MISLIPAAVTKFMAVITLLTDFGTRDAYVGVMKGVVLGINPSVTIVDISHHIHPQDITQAAYMIHRSFKYFPNGTIHVIVIDPGVGTQRAIVAAKLGAHTFLAPNNGVLSMIFGDPAFEYAVKVEATHLFLTPVSPTFHGRDIMAPVSAHLALGVDPRSLGPEIKSSERVTIPTDQPDISHPNSILGRIVSIDHFGNLITNIDESCIRNRFPEDTLTYLKARLNQKVISGLSKTYASVGIQQPAVLMGSHGYLEVAVNRDSAQQHFKAQIGDAVLLWFDDHKT